MSQLLTDWAGAGSVRQFKVRFSGMTAPGETVVCRGRITKKDEEGGEALALGQLLGVKLFLGEFLAFIQLGDMAGTLSDKTFALATFALCGFGNFVAVGIQIGGIAALVPERRADLARIGPRAMLAGALASWQTAAIAAVCSFCQRYKILYNTNSLAQRDTNHGY